MAPSKWKGLVTTPTVRMPRSRAHLAMIGAAPVPVPPPMPAVMNTMCAPSRCSPISGIASSAAPMPTSGWAPAPSPCVTPIAELDAPVGLGEGQLLRVGVGDDELDALQPGLDHVVDGVAAGAADAEDDDARLQLLLILRDAEIDHTVSLHASAAVFVPSPPASRSLRIGGPVCDRAPL